jgi:hypothetical protein
MDIYADSIRDLPAIDRLRLVELIWSDLTKPDAGLPISAQIMEEARIRRDSMIADPGLCKTHEQVWDKIEAWRNG